MKRKMLLALLITAAGYTGCNKSDAPLRIQPADPETGNGIAPGGCIPPADCNTVLCTAVFSDVSLQVKHASGAAATLDSFVVTDAAGVPLAPATPGVPLYGYPNEGIDGVYSVINDSWVSANRNSSRSVRAMGFVKGARVFDEPYTILADCCHVGKQAGKDVVVIP